MTKDEALNLALDFIVATNKSSSFWLVPGSNLNKTVTSIKEALAQPAQAPVAIVVAAEYEDGSFAGHRLEWRGRNEANDFPEGTKFYTTPQQQEPRNFCPRCGKRTEDIHTCTPPEGGHQ